MDETGEDKIFAAMGVAKTITTIVASVDSSPEILAQVQEVVIPIIVLTLENKILGESRSGHKVNWMLSENDRRSLGQHVRACRQPYLQAPRHLAKHVAGLRAYLQAVQV